MGRTTTALLEHAASFLDGRIVKLMTDSGVENINQTVDELLAGSPIRRVLAQVEIPESNSMLEAFWRSLRHQWLYLHELDSLATVRRLVDFYVAEHNAVIPHAAFAGHTPDEVYFDRPSVASELPGRCTAARSSRAQSVAVVRSMCSNATGAASLHQSPVAGPCRPHAHLRRISCRMSWPAARRSPRQGRSSYGQGKRGHLT